MEYEDYHSWLNSLEPKEFLFAISEPDDHSLNGYILITPRKIYEEEDRICDQYCGSDFLDGIVFEMMEATFEPEDNLSLDEVRKKLTELGLSEEPNLIEHGWV